MNFLHRKHYIYVDFTGHQSWKAVEVAPKSVCRSGFWPLDSFGRRTLSTLTQLRAARVFQLLVEWMWQFQEEHCNRTHFWFSAEFELLSSNYRG